MITTPEIICDLFSFLDKDHIEKIQLVNQFWNNVVIRHKNILPLRLFVDLKFIPLGSDQIHLATKEDRCKHLNSYIIKFDRTNLSKIEANVSPRYSQLTVDEVLKHLNDVVFDFIHIYYGNAEEYLGYLLNFIKLITTKTGGRFRGRFGIWQEGRFGSKLNEIFDNYIIVNHLTLGQSQYISDSYIREVCANPEIIQLPSTPKEVRLARLRFKENEEVLNFTCNGKLNGANRLTIEFETPDTNYGNFIYQWFKLYRTHENPISLVGKFFTYCGSPDIVFGAVKTLLNNTQLRVKYSLETAFHSTFCGNIYPYTKRSCVLHETDSYALVIEMAYGEVIDMSSINASDLDQPSCYKMKTISFCVKSL